MKKETPFFSVIIPNYNHAPYLHERIDSVLNQTFTDFEVILLDDKSQDDSRDILCSYQNNPHVAHIVLNDQNSGSTFKQWHKGFELSRGKYIWIAESDDFADVHFLQTAYDVIHKKENVTLVYFKSNIVDSNSTITHRHEPDSGGGIFRMERASVYQREYAEGQFYYQCFFCCVQKNSYTQR